VVVVVVMLWQQSCWWWWHDGYNDGDDDNGTDQDSGTERRKWGKMELGLWAHLTSWISGSVLVCWSTRSSQCCPDGWSHWGTFENYRDPYPIPDWPCQHLHLDWGLQFSNRTCGSNGWKNMKLLTSRTFYVILSSNTAKMNMMAVTSVV
jgi:hypothetical protein